MKLSSMIFTFVIFSFFTFSALAQAEKYGEELSLTEKIKISQILESPQDYIGKRVLVQGDVLDVCKNAGCWMMLRSDKEGQEIRIKVKDGEIVFPVEAIGSNAVVEGEVYAIELDEEGARDYMEHLAEDAGLEFDPSTVTGPMTIYQIKGLGAVITSPVKSGDEVETEM